MLDREVVVFVCSSSRSAERRLQGERINQLELLPHNNSSCCFFRFLNLEVTAFKIEIFTVFMEKQRENSFFQSISTLVRAPIHEQIFAARVTMNVAIE